MQNNSTWAPSPPSQATWPAESFKIVPTLLAAAGAIAVVIASMTLYLLIAIPTGWLVPREPLPVGQAVFVQTIAYAAVAPYLLFILPVVSRLSLRQLGIRVPTPFDIAIGVLGAIAMWLVVATLSAGMESLLHRHDTETSIRLLRSVHTPFEKIAFGTLAVVFAPLVEELAFRVFVFNAFWRRVPLLLAALASGALFGAIHAVSASEVLTIGVPLAAGGVVLALVYARTRCYWSNVLTHAMFNGVTVVAFFVFGVTS